MTQLFNSEVETEISVCLPSKFMLFFATPNKEKKVRGSKTYDHHETFCLFRDQNLFLQILGVELGELSPS